MNDAFVPALGAALSGSAMITGIWLHESAHYRRMRGSLRRHTLTFPPLAPDAGRAVFHALSGLPNDQELVLEVVADGNGVRHAMWVPEASWLSVRASLTGLLPGLRISEGPAPEGRSTVAMKVSVPTPVVLSTENPEAASQTLLAGMTTLNTGEQAVIRWALRPGPAPSLPTDRPLSPAAAEVQKLWRQKTLAGGRTLIVFGTKPGEVLALDPQQQGKVSWRTQALGQLPAVPDALGPNGGANFGPLWGGALDEASGYFGSSTGGAAAVRLSDGQPGFRDPLPHHALAEIASGYQSWGQRR